MLLSVGKPIIDIIVEVDENFLKKYGFKPNDAVKATESQAELFKDILSLNPKFIPGGSVTNTLRVYQWAMENKEKVFYIGVIGKDKFGIQIKSQLEKEMIQYRFLENSTETVQCAVLISSNGRNRSLVTNSNLKATQITDDRSIEFNEFREEITKCNCFYVPTYSLVMFSNIIKDIVEHFTTHQKKIVVNLGATYILEKQAENVQFLIKHADVVIGNNEEYKVLAKIFNILNADLSKTLMEIRSIGRKIGTFVVTRGEQDIIVYSDEGVRYFTVDSIHVVDTTGAGDAFAGGFLTQYMKNSPLDSCIYCGIACARHIVQQFGCDFNLNFNRNALFINEHCNKAG